MTEQSTDNDALPPSARDLYDRAADLLLTLPACAAEADRQALLARAFRDSKILRQITTGGNTDTFVQNLISRCAAFGDIDSQPALVVLLQKGVRPTVGRDKKAEIDQLCGLPRRLPDSPAPIPVPLPPSLIWAMLRVLVAMLAVALVVGAVWLFVFAAATPTTTRVPNVSDDNAAAAIGGVCRDLLGTRDNSADLRRAMQESSATWVNELATNQPDDTRLREELERKCNTVDAKPTTGNSTSTSR